MKLLRAAYPSFKTCLLTVGLVLISLGGTARAVNWSTAERDGNTAYFFSSDSSRVERYDLAGGQWLTAITLPSNHGTIGAGHVDAQGLYVGFGAAVYRYALNGSGETHLITASSPIRSLHTDGNVLFINHSNSLYAYFISINKTNNTIIASSSNYVDSVAGSAIAPSLNRIVGSREGVSPDDVTYMEYSDDGQFLSYGESPYHGDYPASSKVWVFPSEGRFVDDAGIIYSTSALSYGGSLGGSVTDVAFLDGDIPVVLSGTKLTAYSAALLPVGSVTLPVAAKSIFLSGSSVFTFTPDNTTPNGIRVDSVALSSLSAPKPGSPVDPLGVPFTPAASFIDKLGVLYLFSPVHQSLFRWDTATQQYLPSIPLVGVPDFAAYSAVNDTIYLAYHSGLIRELDLTASTLSEVPFAQLPQTPNGLATAGAYIFAVDPSGAWNTHYTFDPSGILVSSVDWNYFSREFIWSDIRQRMFFFRDDTSPNDLLSEQINANGTAYPSLAAGAIGTEMDSPLHDSTGFSHPIRISPDGSVVVLGSGSMHDAGTLARLTTNLSNPIIDAAWLSTTLHTIRTISGVAQFQKWSQPTYGLSSAFQVPGTAHALYALSNGRLLGITLSSDGIPSFYELDGQFNVQAPGSLQAPFGLEGSIVSNHQIDLSWLDVSGETSYKVERKTAGGSWSQIATTGISATQFSDSTVVTGLTYNYRVIAVNGSQASAPSAEVEVVNTPIPVPTFTVALWAYPSVGGAASGAGTFSQGLEQTVTATPATGYTFTGWTENGYTVSSLASYSFTVNQNRSLTANFRTIAVPTFNIFVSASPTLGGTVYGAGAFKQNSRQTVAAAAYDGYSFSGWLENGSIVSTAPSYTFTVTGNRTLTASFSPIPAPPCTVTVWGLPSQGGTVTGAGSFSPNSQQTVTAAASAGFAFTGWVENGVIVSTSPNYTFTVSGDRNLGATFSSVPIYYSMAVRSSSAPKGRVVGSGTFSTGGVSTVRAIARPGYKFVRWAEGGKTLSSQPVFRMKMTADHSLVAYFARK